MFNDSIIQEIADQWNSYQSRPNFGIAQKNPPKVSYIRKIVEAIYCAGLKQEEEVPIRVRVALVDGEQLNHELRANKNIVMFFEKKLPFTVDTLVKLAPAFDHVTTAIIVSPSEKSSDELEIVGACCSTRRGRTELESFIGYNPPPDVFTVTVRKPGYLVFSRGGGIICQFKDGEFLPARANQFNKGALGGFIYRSACKHSEFQGSENRYVILYLEGLALLLMEGQRRGHGGTIIWLPKETVEHAERFLIHRHLIGAVDGVPKSIFSEVIEWTRQNFQTANKISETPMVDAKISQYLDDTSRFMLNSRRDVIEYIEFIAQLICIDGALIITDMFEPLSFGTQLKAPTWKGKILTGPDAFHNRLEPIDRTKRGMRHNSAVDFVGACPGSIAFVVSQDGLIGAMTRHDANTIYWWPDCLTQMWEE